MQTLSPTKIGYYINSPNNFVKKFSFSQKV